jgi:LysM repeat protein
MGQHSKPRHVARHAKPPRHLPVTAGVAGAVVTGAVIASAVPALAAPVTVKPGDTLSGLAARYCGSAAAWTGLYRANAATVKNPDLIYVGQVLNVACAHHHTASVAAAVVTPAAGGTLSCAGLETLWDSVGGRPAAAEMAAAVAMAESSGEPAATNHDTNGSVDRGLWQINSANGALSTYSEAGNALAAVELSGNGTNWSPWVTYTTGAYRGRC